jgi:hypothetical protein
MSRAAEARAEYNVLYKPDTHTDTKRRRAKRPSTRRPSLLRRRRYLSHSQLSNGRFLTERRQSLEQSSHGRFELSSAAGLGLLFTFPGTLPTYPHGLAGAPARCTSEKGIAIPTDRRSPHGLKFKASVKLCVDHLRRSRR